MRTRELVHYQHARIQRLASRKPPQDGGRDADDGPMVSQRREAARRDVRKRMTEDGRPVQGAFGFGIHRLRRMSRDFRYRTLNRIRILLRIPQHPSGKVRRQIARIPHGLVVPQGGYAS